MSEFTKHEPGTFSWAELGTTDQAGAKAFYTELFGWSFEDNEMDPGNYYTMFKLRGKPVAAGYKLGERMAGVPPHWQCYVSVASVDESAKKAKELGAEIIAPPFDVMVYGRMAVIKDPTGATLSLWEAKKHIGAGIAREAHSIVWTELMTRDTDAATKFYTELFGWKAVVQEMGPMKYTSFKNGEQPMPLGGMMQMDADMAHVPPHWHVYFGSEDTDATVERAKQHGGKVIVPPTDIPGVGRFALLTDPQGAAFSVIKFNMPG